MNVLNIRLTLDGISGAVQEAFAGGKHLAVVALKKAIDEAVKSAQR